jgi:thyrotropin-releasing hormone receptor
MFRMNFSDEECACDMPRWLYASAQAYKGVHGPLAVVVCVLGSVANCLNLVVLRELRAAPVNRILSWLAMVDVCVMLLYLPFAYEVYLDPDRHWRSFLPAWAAFLLLHMQLAQVRNYAITPKD